MSWAYGIDETGREVGYGVEAICDLDGCEAEIDRGLAYRCGGHDFDAGCGGFFCPAHLLYATLSGVPQQCPACMTATDREDAPVPRRPGPVRTVPGDAEVGEERVVKPSERLLNVMADELEALESAADRRPWWSPARWWLRVRASRLRGRIHRLAAVVDYRWPR